MAKLASRQAREAEFEELAGEECIVTSSGGHCQRDAVHAVEAMYKNFARAMHDTFSVERPAQPVLYLDATGGALGRGITHVEAGSADFAGTTKQSRSTLAPLGLYEGSDKGLPLREHLDLVLPSWNKLVIAGKLRVIDENVPARPITSAGMQGTKALYGQTSNSHSVWCRCLRGDKQQHAYCKDAVESPSTRCAAGRTTRRLWRAAVSLSALSAPAAASYAPFEKKWRGDVAKFAQLSDAEQEAARKEHNEVGAKEQLYSKHFNQQLYLYPGVLSDMEFAGVDGLHLIFLNAFKHLFDYTLQQGFPAKKLQLIKAYLKKAGFYSYDAAAEDENPVARWIGRE
eukprot:3974862-Pleurochrysis_carterae.AAC.1